MQFIEAADRLVSLSSMVVAAAIAGERERIGAVVDRFVGVALSHVGEVGPSMWTETQGALWRTFHRALLDRARHVVRAVLLDERVPECAGDLAFVAQHYRSAVARRSLHGPRDLARDQLRIAYEMLSTMGVETFAERARRELPATGETVRKRAVETVMELTAREAHIARLAAEGHTNSEIGAQLFICARTVEWHLRKVFTKLGTGSRRELRSALAQLGQLDLIA